MEIITTSQLYEIECRVEAINRLVDSLPDYDDRLDYLAQELADYSTALSLLYKKTRSLEVGLYIVDRAA